MTKNRAPPGSLNPQIITFDGEAARLVEGDPVLHSVSKSFEAGKSISLKVRPVRKHRLSIKLGQ